MTRPGSGRSEEARSGKLDIAPSREDELEAISACAAAAYSLYLARMDRPPAPILTDYRSLLTTGALWSLRAADKLAGFIVLLAKPGILFVENVALHPDYQGRGLGRVLMAFAEDKARARGLRRIELYTNVVMTENIGFYERLGYQVTEKKLEDGYQRLYFAKDLDFD